MTVEDALFLYQLLTTNGITSWLIGGWGIDALFGEQTRTHKDLDILVLVDDVVRLQSLLEREGLHFAYLWEENRFVQDRQGNATATAFVWQDDAGREIDAHAMWLDDQGNGVPAWSVEKGFLFSREDLAEQGASLGAGCTASPQRCSWCAIPGMISLKFTCATLSAYKGNLEGFGRFKIFQ